MIDGPEPVNVMLPWRPFSLNIQQAYEDYRHEKMVERVMSMPPTRGRRY